MMNEMVNEVDSANATAQCNCTVCSKKIFHVKAISDKRLMLESIAKTKVTWLFDE